MYFSMEKIDDQLIWERRGLFWYNESAEPAEICPSILLSPNVHPILAREKHCILFWEKWKQFAHSSPIYLTSVAILQTQPFLQITATFYSSNIVFYFEAFRSKTVYAFLFPLRACKPV